MITVKFERHVKQLTYDKVVAVARAYKTLDPPVKERMQRKLGGNYIVYQGDNHIALHALTWWKYYRQGNARKPSGGKLIGERFAVLTDGIEV